MFFFVFNFRSIAVSLKSSLSGENLVAHQPYAFCMPDSQVVVMYICQYHSNPFRPNRFVHRPDLMICNKLHAMLSGPFLRRNKYQKQIIRLNSIWTFFHIIYRDSIYSPNPNFAYFFMCHSSFSNGKSFCPSLPNSSIRWRSAL